MIFKIRTDVKSLNQIQVLQNKNVRRNAERFFAELKRGSTLSSGWITADGKVVDARESSCLYFDQYGDVVKIERSIYWYPGLTE